MRRLLLPLLVLSLAPFAPAHAACDPETCECYPTDCVVWQPRVPKPAEVVADPVRALDALLPPTCP